jgi:hypothetical protein
LFINTIKENPQDVFTHDRDTDPDNRAVITKYMFMPHEQNAGYHNITTANNSFGNMVKLNYCRMTTKAG